ncbi:leucine-rich melanocyte differentiation-associated protein-like [Dreissena polymorpha]|uniref:Uncharacterized protein n=1 Tax=Dreissena polymorpha TaxID=45954 RepID=A0A9D4M104_DREPO|nr:leucine-rich melanocyte differentiation-associated protein-like [Dreissena polymorpha]KAH3866456.1 hypothetical protein DPMN_029520 [Dreissena polymorpha]
MEEMTRRQNLAHQKLTEIPEDIVDRTAQLVEELDLSYNRISDLRFLLAYTKLQSLVLDHNCVTSHTQFPDMPHLHTLWLNHNKIQNLSVFISTISKKCTNLRYLSMMNNPAAPSYFNNGTFEQYTDYRHFVISRLPKLQMLDDTKIDDKERSEAERVYRPVRKKKAANPS